MSRERLSRSVTAKLTETEYRKVFELAEEAGCNLSEFVRDCLVSRSEKCKTYTAQEVILAEVLAFRSAFLTLTFQLRGGRDLSEQQMRELINQAEHNKYIRARERLEVPKLSPQKSEVPE